MADDLTYTDTSPAGVPDGTKQATDEHATRGHMPLVKLAYSADGDATPVTADANGLEVQGTVAVTGVATAANQATEIGHLDGLEGLLTTIDADTSNLSVVGGGTEAAAIRVTIANNSTGVVSVDDNGGTLTVDGTVAATQSGTFTVTPATVGSGTAAAAARVELANNGTGVIATVGAVTAITNALPAGTNAIGKLAANSGVDIGDVTVADGTLTTVTTLTGGGIAHDSADSGNPHKVGGKARATNPAAVAAADRVDGYFDTQGRQVVANQCQHEDIVQGVTAAITGTASTEVIATGGAGVRNYITSLTVTNSHATVSTVVEIRSGASTVMHRGYALAAGGGYTVTFPTPLRSAANEAVNAFNITTGSNVYVSASGYRAAV